MEDFIQEDLNIFEELTIESQAFILLMSEIAEEDETFDIRSAIERYFEIMGLIDDAEDREFLN